MDLDKNSPAAPSHAALTGPRRMLAHLAGLEGKVKRKGEKKKKKKEESKAASIPAQGKGCQAALEIGSLCHGSPSNQQKTNSGQ